MRNFTKVLFLIVCVAAMPVVSHAQEGSSFGAFVAMPVGSFKSTSIEDGGFAETGWGLVFDTKSKVKFFPKDLLLYSHSTYQWNNMNNEKLSTAFTEALGMRTEVTKSRYAPLLTTLGPSYMMHLSDKFKLVLNGTAGIMFNNTRAFGIRVYDNAGNEVVKEAVNFDNNVAFAYTLGFELRFPLLKDIFGGAIYVDYTGARQNTTMTFETVDPVKSFQKLQYLNLGFKFSFPKKEAE